MRKARCKNEALTGLGSVNDFYHKLLELMSYFDITKLGIELQNLLNSLKPLFAPRFEVQRKKSSHF